jgi:4'-phosphopantetheinyl transferase
MSGHVMTAPTSCPWIPAPPGLRLCPEHVDLWQCPTDLPADALAHFQDFLSDDERRKADRLLNPAARTQSVLARGLLRRLLGCLLQTDPRALAFAVAPLGKPYLTHTWHGGIVTFNVSHTCGRVLIALTLNREIGIDVEHVRPDFEWEPIASRFFPPEESAAIQSLPAADRTRAFYKRWVRRESFLKMTGDGASRGLNPPDPTWESAVTDLDVAPGYAAALAVAGRAPLLRRWLAPAVTPAPSE